MEDKYPFSYFYGAWGKVYTLADQQGNVFYVGATTQPMEQRIAQHILEARNWKPTKRAINERKANKIKSLNYRITATIIEMKWVTASRSKDLLSKIKPSEKIWIDKYFELGFPLVNRVPFTVRKATYDEYVGKSYTTSSKEILEVEPADVLINAAKV